jgi:hypothetical protein
MADGFLLVRLTGDGDASGGGLSLPDAFTAVAQELLDSGPAEDGRLTEVVTAACAYKEKRVLAQWATWDDFTRDILAQLQVAGLAEKHLDRWYLSLGFIEGQRMIVIPESNIGITVYGKAERRRRNALAKARLEVRRTAAQLRQDGVDDALLHDALDALAGMMLTEEPPEAKPGKEKEPRKAKGDRPAPMELARRKYWSDSPNRVKNRFSEDGTRPCPACGLPRTPEEFAVYWGNENKRTGDWYFYPSCIPCAATAHRAMVRRAKQGKA